MKRRVRVVAGLFTRGETVLVQQRRSEKARGLLWEFPGGKVEPGETDEAALERECREELGVPVSVGPRRWDIVHEYEDLIVELVVHVASMPPGAEPKPHDAHRLSWVPRGELASLPFCAADVPLIPRLARGEL